MGRHNHIATRADILRVLGGSESTISDIANRLCISAEMAAHHLKVLHKEGSLERRKEIVPHSHSPGSRTMFVYASKDKPVYEAQVAGVPYRNLRLTENLTGYESSLFAFAGLCMAVRR